MKRLLLSLLALPLAGLAYAAGGQSALTVSSGTFLPIDTYSNSDGANRQAIVIGDRSSSATLTVDPVIGITVNLATSTAIQQVYDNRPATMTVIGSTVGISGTVPVTGTFFQTTQPISGNVTVIGSTVGISGTIPVSGTFFQGTQPVSLAAPVNVTGSTVGIVGNFSATGSSVTVFTSQGQSLPVSGTFFQGTQPVSIAAPLQVANSTIAISNSISVSGSSMTVFATQGGAIPVSQGGTIPWTIGNSTIAISNTITSSVANSTMAVVQSGGVPWQISNSTIGITGTLSATISNPTYGQAFPASGPAIKGDNGEALAQKGQSSSSATYTYQVNVSSIVNGGTPFQVSNSTLSVSNVIAPTTFGSTSFTQAIPVGGIGVGGGFQTFQVTAASAAYVYVVNPATVAAHQIITSTVGVVNGGSVFQIGNSTLAIAGTLPTTVSNSTIAVVQAGNWSIVNSTVGVILSSGVTVLVSSNTALPAQGADATLIRPISDKHGRLMTIQDADNFKILNSTAILTTSTAERVFISSNTTGFNHIINCIGVNTSATNTFVTFRPASNGTGSNTNSFVLGFPANDVPVGFHFPKYQKSSNSNWTIQGNDSVSSLQISCDYYQEN